MHEIKKIFHLAYGHRLQNHGGKCRNLHGHNGLVEVTLAAARLNSGGMVMDFSELGGRVSAWLEANIDHKVILAASDPLAEVLEKQGQACFLTAGAPTAETLAKIIFDACAGELSLPVREVAFWETPSARASYRAGGR